MCERKKRDDNQNYSQRRGFRNQHDSRIFVEPFDFFYVFSGIDFTRFSFEKYLDRFEKRDHENED